MKTAISLPDDDFARFDRVAARNGMTRSEFYHRAGRKLADELEGSSRLTAIADAAIARAGQPTDELVVSETRRLLEQGDRW